jgi:spore coat protein CotF
MEMEEKYMVNDILESVKAELTTYQGVISEAANMQLRQTVQAIRDSDESFQYELFKVAQAKGYYIPAEQAQQKEIDKIKNEIS